MTPTDARRIYEQHADDVDMIVAAVDSEAEEIRQGRQELRMTQAQFAEQLGVSRTTVAMWESGRTVPRRVHLLLMRALVSQARVRLGLKLRKIHSCFCYDAGYEAGRANGGAVSRCQ